MHSVAKINFWKLLWKKNQYGLHEINVLSYANYPLLTINDIDVLSLASFIIPQAFS